MNRKVTIIDFGSGNLHSVCKAFGECGADVKVTDDARVLKSADRIVLPGVGAFYPGMEKLESNGIAETLTAFASRNRPLLGICLGMQMLFSRSQEFGIHAGLNILKGNGSPIPAQPGLKVPHTGWSCIRPPQGGDWANCLLDEIPINSRFYFVHSYFANPDEEADRVADVFYGDNRMSAVVQHGQIFGCQFHPEKSGLLGLKILRNFLAA